MTLPHLASTLVCCFPPASRSNHHLPFHLAMVDPLPNHWYFFFGLLEPISVLAGTIYAVCFPERYNHELIPPAFVSASKIQSSLQTFGVLPQATRMALAQLASCYFLIMLNSALMFFALRKFLRGKDDVSLEKILRYLIIVLGAADCKSSLSRARSSAH